MPVSQVVDANIKNSTVRKQLKFAAMQQTLAGALTMDADYPPIVSLDPGGAGRDVLLPAEEEGLVYIIINLADAAEDLTVKEDSDTTTIGTVSQNEVGIFVCGYDATNALEWSALVATST